MTLTGTEAGTGAGGVGGTGDGLQAEWFDSHAHIQDSYLDRGGTPELREERDVDEAVHPLLAAALERSAAAGVRRIVCVGTGVGTSAAALELAARSARGELAAVVADPPDLWATVGLHPHDASEGADATLSLLDSSAGAVRLVAVGECGLDYHYEHSPRDVQRQAFAMQIAAAHRLGLALVIHAREAWEDLFDVLAGEGVPERTVLHCFTGGPGEVRRCLDAGMYVSFSGIVTFKNAGEVREAAALCPLDRLLLETDSPFLAPVPYRGHPNEPAHVALVGAAVAEVKGVEPSVLAAASTSCARALFGL